MARQQLQRTAHVRRPPAQRMMVAARARRQPYTTTYTQPTISYPTTSDPKDYIIIKQDGDVRATGQYSQQTVEHTPQGYIVKTWGLRTKPRSGGYENEPYVKEYKRYDKDGVLLERQEWRIKHNHQKYLKEHDKYKREGNSVYHIYSKHKGYFKKFNKELEQYDYQQVYERGHRPGYSYRQTTDKDGQFYTQKPDDQAIKEREEAQREKERWVAMKNYQAQEEYSKQIAQLHAAQLHNIRELQRPILTRTEPRTRGDFYSALTPDIRFTGDTYGTYPQYGTQYPRLESNPQHWTTPARDLLTSKIHWAKQKYEQEKARYKHDYKQFTTTLGDIYRNIRQDQQIVRPSAPVARPVRPWQGWQQEMTDLGVIFAPPYDLARDVYYGGRSLLDKPFNPAWSGYTGRPPQTATAEQQKTALVTAGYAAAFSNPYTGIPAGLYIASQIPRTVGQLSTLTTPKERARAAWDISLAGLPLIPAPRARFPKFIKKTKPVITYNYIPHRPTPKFHLYYETTPLKYKPYTQLKDVYFFKKPTPTQYQQLLKIAKLQARQRSLDIRLSQQRLRRSKQFRREPYTQLSETYLYKKPQHLPAGPLKEIALRRMRQQRQRTTTALQQLKLSTQRLRRRKDLRRKAYTQLGKTYLFGPERHLTQRQLRDIALRDMRSQRTAKKQFEHDLKLARKSLRRRKDLRAPTADLGKIRKERILYLRKQRKLRKQQKREWSIQQSKHAQHHRQRRSDLDRSRKIQSKLHRRHRRRTKPTFEPLTYLDDTGYIKTPQALYHIDKYGNIIAKATPTRKKITLKKRFLDIQPPKRQQPKKAARTSQGQLLLQKTKKVTKTKQKKVQLTRQQQRLQPLQELKTFHVRKPTPKQRSLRLLMQQNTGVLTGQYALQQLSSQLHHQQVKQLQLQLQRQAQLQEQQFKYQKQKQYLKLKLKFRQKTRQSQRPELLEETKRRQPLRLLRITRKGKTRAYLPQTEQLAQAYQLLVKEQGQWQPKGYYNDQEAAEAYGRDYTDAQQAHSFTIERQLAQRRNIRSYRGRTANKHKFTKRGRIYLEKPRYRNDNYGEFMFKALRA